MRNHVERSLKNVLYPLFWQSRAPRPTIRSLHSLCSIAATGIPNVVTPEYARAFLNESPNSSSPSVTKVSNKPRLRFHRPRTNNSEYIPYAQRLIEGISVLDGDRTWTLVHELIMESYLSPKKCPEFAEFEHVVRLGDFSLALSTLFWKEHYSPSIEVESLDTEAEVFTEHSTELPNRYPPSLDIPTWLSAYMLSTMVNTRATAVKSFDFCLKMLDMASKPMAASLLLLSMCSLTRFNVIYQIPPLISAFSDIVFPSSQSVHPDPVISSNSSHPSRPLIVFQCNVLLNLLSELPHSVMLGKVTTRFLRQMQGANVSLETDTAKKLLGANFATQEMASLITEILRNQHGTLAGNDYSDVYISLARFYTKRRDLTRASKLMEETRNYHIDKHLRTYLRAFQDTAYAFKYIREATGISGDDSLEKQDEDILSRPVYVSLLRSAAQCRTISTQSFLKMFKVIRDQFDDDKRLYTIALIGLIRRRDFEQAKILWNEWMDTVDQLEIIIGHLQGYLSERQRKYKDGYEVREALGWDKETELLAKRKLRRLQIDSDALVLAIRAVSGPKPDSLVIALSLMEKYAHKKYSSITPRVVNCFMNRAVYFRRPDLIFELWDGMEAYYGVSPSLGSLIILLRASRMSASMSSSIQRFVPKWLRRKISTAPMDASLNEKLMYMLQPTYAPDISWYSWEPWRIARYIFREKIMYRNWPELRAVHVPALAVRGDLATSSIDALREAELHRQMKDLNFGLYYHLLPDQQTFKQYVLMLGRVQRSSEIPEVLAWMKELDIVPTKLTLSVFLALWSQVGLDPFVNEGWNTVSGHNIEHGGEYGQLIAWLERWVGKENIPTDGEILETFKYLDIIENKESVLY